MRCLEDGLHLFWNLREVNVTLLRDTGHELLRVPPFCLSAGHEGRVHIRHHRARLVAHESDGEDRLDPSGTPGEDGNGAGWSHCRQVTVSELAHGAYTMSGGVSGAKIVRSPNGFFPRREGPSGFSEVLRRVASLLVQEAHHFAAHLSPLCAVVGDPVPEELETQGW